MRIRPSALDECTLADADGVIGRAQSSNVAGAVIELIGIAAEEGATQVEIEVDHFAFWLYHDQGVRTAAAHAGIELVPIR